MNLFNPATHKNIGRRMVMIALALLMISGVMIYALPTANAAEGFCTLDEHTHEGGCYEIVCGLKQGPQYGPHTHGEDCYTSVLGCDCAEGVEHTDECYTTEKVCTLEEGERVLLGEHEHTLEDCCDIICGMQEHTHTPDCFGGEVENLSVNGVSIEAYMIRPYDYDGYRGYYDGAGNYIPRTAHNIFYERYEITISDYINYPIGEDSDHYIADGSIRVYIPIPRMGDEWGAANSGVDAEGNKISTFAYNTVLDSDAGKNADDNEVCIYYYYMDTYSIAEDASADTVFNKFSYYLENKSDRYSNQKNHNVAEIRFVDPVPGKTYTFTFPTATNEHYPENHDRVNIFSPLCSELVMDEERGTYKRRSYTSGMMGEIITMPSAEGVVWEDTNANGIQDENEPGIAGIPVTYSSGSLTATTDENGRYLITDIAKVGTGDSISIVPDLDRYALSPKDAGDDERLDSDAEMSDTKAVIKGLNVFHESVDGHPTYRREYADIGLVPYVDVNYSWVGSAPAAAVLPDSAEGILSGSEFTAASVSAVANYTFDGWYTDEACTDKFANGDQIIGETTLYGKWKHNTITVSGTKTWENVPGGYTLPEVTVDLMLDGKVVDSTVIAADKNTYSFSGLDRYAANGSELKYSVKEQAVEHFTAAYSEARTDEDGNVVIDITNTGDFVYGDLVITNKVTGTGADKNLKFSFKVEFSAAGSYSMSIYGAGETVPSSGSTGMLGRLSISAAGARAATGTVKSGDTIQLAHGETAVISDLPAGTTYKVTAVDTKGYKVTGTGTNGSVGEDGVKAAFISEKVSSGSSAEGPKTGDNTPDGSIAIVVMQTAMLASLVCVVCMKKLGRKDEETEQF